MRIPPTLSSMVASINILRPSTLTSLHLTITVVPANTGFLLLQCLLDYFYEKYKNYHLKLTLRLAVKAAGSLFAINVQP
jgi:hypothetical protein